MDKTANKTDADIYENAFRSLPDGILLLDKEGNFLDANDSFLKILEMTKEEVSRSLQSLTTFYRIYDSNMKELPLAQWPVLRVTNNETLTNEKLVLENLQKKKHTFVSCSAFPQTDKNGNVISSTIVIKDISIEINNEIQSKNKIAVQTEHLDQLRFTQQQLKNDRELIQTIIDTIPVMITIYNENLDSLIFNNAFEKITGWTREDVKKTNIMELAYPDPEYRAEVFDFQYTKEAEFKDILLRTKDGRDLETSWANVKIADGRQVGVGLDISERKKMEKELIFAREKAEKENRIQTAFIQNISHEVRTPMNSILGFAGLLQKTINNSRHKEFLDAISFNGKQLLRLIEDIIDISRLDKNEMSLSKETIHVSRLLKQMETQLEGLKKTYEKKHLQTRTIIPENAEAIFIHTDLTRIQQVFTNMLSNALKYTTEGTVDFGFEINEKEKVLFFYVKDTGMGIKKEYHSQVFQRFNRFHSGDNLFRGTGLGLAICKNIVQLLGGKIGFESEYGKGSLFYFTHPYIKKEDIIQVEQKKEDKNDYSTPYLKGKKILIAEDDHFSFMLMEQMLLETEATILHAATGLQAVDLFLSEGADIVFLDIRMPEMSGFQVIKKIRKQNATVPVIAQTANAMAEDRQNIILSGFNYHATKPFSQDVLFSILNRFM